MKAGDQLFSSCRAEVAGHILRVGLDDIGEDVIDLYVADLNEFLDTRWAQSDHPNASDLLRAMTLEDYQADRRIKAKLGAVLTDLQFEDNGDGYFTFNTPGNGCHRCTSSFSVVVAGSEWYNPQYLPAAPERKEDSL